MSDVFPIFLTGTICNNLNFSFPVPQMFCYAIIHQKVIFIAHLVSYNIILFFIKVQWTYLSLYWLVSCGIEEIAWGGSRFKPYARCVI